MDRERPLELMGYGPATEQAVINFQRAEGIPRSGAEISTAVQTGELIQHLLSDLASADSTPALRHEIALAALNHTVWNQNPNAPYGIK